MCDSGESKRQQFGNRNLTDKSQVFEHNAWDNAEWGAEQEDEAKKKVETNAANKVSESRRDELENEASSNWDSFYSIHQNRFFKDRHWLFTEFPEILTTTEQNRIARSHSNLHTRILETGCGVGNTIMPLLETISDPRVFIYGCDFSETAVNFVKTLDTYDTKRCLVFHSDLTDQTAATPIETNSVDIILMLFVLSSVSPSKMSAFVASAAKYLSPGGRLLFRDYGRYDMAQLRFGSGKCISDNFYVRGDGTRAYFFETMEVDDLMSGAGLVEVRSHVDRRLQVNRIKRLKMYRVWVQAVYENPAESKDN